ncbi:MAG: hypothetical protein JXR78_05630 [Victivallales bacterium]|nr:hypothetical protein [Victivallales bacterium]
MSLLKKLFIGSVVSFITVSSLCAQKLETFTITDFSKGNNGWTLNRGKEFPPGTKGMLSMFRSKEDGCGLRISYDFSAGGNYIAINKGFSPIDIKELKFKIKTMAKTIAIRVKDSKEQSLQMYLNITPSEDWQDISISGFDKKGNFPSHWGGPNDGVVHQPISMIDIVFGKDNCPPKGEIIIGNISAVIKK